MENLKFQGALESVITHELGHVCKFSKLEPVYLLSFHHVMHSTSCHPTDTVGIGSLWDAFGLVGETDCPYNGNAANAQWEALTTDCGTQVPTEQSGDESKACVHWDEDCLQNELMSSSLGTLSSRIPNPLSRITIGALEDLGYSVDYSQADPYTIDIDNCVCPSGSRRQLRGNKNEESDFVVKKKYVARFATGGAATFCWRDEEK